MVIRNEVEINWEHFQDVTGQYGDKQVSRQSCFYGYCFRHNPSHQACAGALGHAEDVDPWQHITKIAGAGEGINNKAQP